METTNAIQVRPILFCGEMVRAILQGEKTQTRRIAKVTGIGCKPGFITPVKSYTPRRVADHISYCPYGRPGDLLWVRETWWECIDNNDRVYYAATETPETTDRRHYKKRPSIFMRRTSSRITLKITDIQLELVQEITRADAKAEGFLPSPYNGLESWNGRSFGNAQLAFQACWRDINGHKSWDDNPFVWVVEFQVV